MRFLGAVVASVLVASLGTLAACAANDKEETVPTAKAVSGASVQIQIVDENGTRIGDASGVLIAPRLVLTAGHTISGKYKWQVTSADGKQKVLGSRGMTYDWQTYDSQKAHPRRHDIGVIHLDAPIKLDAYPRLVGDKAVDNLAATRIRGTGASFETLPVTLKKVATSPNNYLADFKGGETLDTGGAVYDERGIVGIVSGRGLATGNLYVARTDQLNSWLSAKVSCAGARTYSPPAEDKSTAICDDAGNPLSSSGTPGTTSGTPGTPNTSSNPPGDGTCSDNNDGICSGANCGTGGTNATNPNGDDDDDNTNSGGPNGNPGAGNGNGSGPGTGGTNGTNPSGDDDDDSTGGTNPNQPGGPTTGQSSGETGTGSGQGTGNGGTNGNKGSSSGGTTGNGKGNGTGGGNGKGGGAGSNQASHDGESCQGATDNPETCPPEPDGCSGSACGGGYPDDLIEYGNCACSSSSSDDGEIHVH